MDGAVFTSALPVWATILKIGVVIVSVCLHRCQKNSVLSTICACSESKCEWVSTWEQSGITVRVIVWKNSLKQSMGHADRRNTGCILKVVSLSNCLRSTLPEWVKKTNMCLLCLIHAKILWPLFQSPTTKHNRFILRNWHQLEQKTSVILSK